MGKGGYEKRRLAQKKQREKQARRRQQRNKRFAQALVILTVLALIGGVTFAIVSGGDDDKPLLSGNTGCDVPGAKAPNKQPLSKRPTAKIDPKKTYIASLQTSCGTIRVTLLAKDAPETVGNFVALSRLGFYNGTIFHRVIKGFMNQAGDAVNADGTGDPGYRFGDENFRPMTEPGLLAMANSGPKTNGSQFFITVDATGAAHLNEKGTCPAKPGTQASCHSVFGTLLDGLDVIQRINSVPTENDKPKTDVVLITVTIEEK